MVLKRKVKHCSPGVEFFSSSVESFLTRCEFSPASFQFLARIARRRSFEHEFRPSMNYYDCRRFLELRRRRTCEIFYWF